MLTIVLGIISNMAWMRITRVIATWAICQPGSSLCCNPRYAFGNWN
jgi:hypothetical protein